MDQKIAIPVSDKNFCVHFGESKQFAIFDISDKKIVNENYLDPPPHKPGAFPRWLVEKGITHIIAGGLGRRALEHFHHYGITPIIGVQPKPIEDLVRDFINDQLTSGTNKCHH